jgi:hypothetical protein
MELLPPAGTRIRNAFNGETFIFTHVDDGASERGGARDSRRGNRARAQSQLCPWSPMSETGQTEKSGRSTGRSALPPTPDVALHCAN